MTIIVTGSKGFIGKRLMERLHDCGQHLHEMDKVDGFNICSSHLQSFGVSQVFHLAAQTDAYSKDVEEDARTNIMGTIRLLEEYKSKLIFVSTAMVNYPVNAYAISKRAAEAYCRLYGAAVVRLPNVYGPGGHSFIDKCKTQDTITIYGKGDQLRTWVHVDKAVEAILKARPGSFTIVPGWNATIKEIAAKHDKPIKYLPARDNDLQVAVQIETLS